MRKQTPGWKLALFNAIVTLALKVEKLFTDRVEVTIFVRNPSRPDADLMVTSERDMDLLCVAIKANAQNEEVRV
jgi:hypothetical protein